MKPALICAAIAALLPVNAAAYTTTYYLVRDLGVKDMIRRCLYSDKEVYAFNASELCPQSIEGEPYRKSYTSRGYKKAEYQDGMTKICVYDVMGEAKSIRIKGTSLCPLTADF